MNTELPRRPQPLPHSFNLARLLHDYADRWEIERVERSTEWVAAAVVDVGGGVQGEAGERCSLLYQVKKSWHQARACWMEANRAGNDGRYVRVLNWLSE